MADGTFMPKPLFATTAADAHAPEFVEGRRAAVRGDGYAGFSQMGLHYIAGYMKHARALAAIIAPTTNSYKRLVPGYEAPVNLAYSRRNRSAACRIPMYSANPKASGWNSGRRTQRRTRTCVRSDADGGLAGS